MNIALGTYRVRGDLRSVVSQAVRDGCCYIDTAPNYHHGRALEEIGAAIETVSTQFCPDDVLVSSKVGYASADEIASLVRDKIATEEDVARGRHVLAPGYTRLVFARTLAMLRRRKLDTFFLHNPEEQHARHSATSLERVFLRVFEVLEEFCAAGQLRRYGIATWDGFGRHNNPGVLNLDHLLELASRVAGDKHHLRAIQLPINLARSDAAYDLLLRDRGVLADAISRRIAVYASSPLHGGELLRVVNETLANEIEQGRSPAEACLRFVMSMPGIDAVIVSASTREHLLAARDLAGQPPLERADLRRILRLMYDC